MSNRGTALLTKKQQKNSFKTTEICIQTKLNFRMESIRIRRVGRRFLRDLRRSKALMIRFRSAQMLSKSAPHQIIMEFRQTKFQCFECKFKLFADSPVIRRVTGA